MGQPTFSRLLIVNALKYRRRVISACLAFYEKYVPMRIIKCNRIICDILPKTLTEVDGEVNGMSEKLDYLLAGKKLNYGATTAI